MSDGLALCSPEVFAIVLGPPRQAGGNGREAIAKPGMGSHKQKRFLLRPGVTSDACMASQGGKISQGGKSKESAMLSKRGDSMEGGSSAVLPYTTPQRPCRQNNLRDLLLRPSLAMAFRQASSHTRLIQINRKSSMDTALSGYCRIGSPINHLPQVPSSCACMLLFPIQPSVKFQYGRIT